MAGKIVEITPERSKELDEWVIKSFNQLDNTYPKFLELILQKSLIVEDENFGDYRHAFTHAYEPIKGIKITLQLEYCLNIYDQFVFVINENNDGNKIESSSTHQVFHIAAYNAISKILDTYSNRFGTKGKHYLVFFKIFEAYRSWINAHSNEIKQMQLPVITDELPVVKLDIPDWIQDLKQGESIWVGYTDHSKWEYPDGYRMYFELEQFQSLDDYVVITNKSSIHFSYVYRTDSDFQFFHEGRNYISAEPFHYEDFATTFAFMKGGKAVKLSKDADQKRSHEILTMGLNFKWFELLKNKPKSKGKSKANPKKKLKETKLTHQVKSIWKINQVDAFEIYGAEKGYIQAERALTPFFSSSKLDDCVKFQFTKTEHVKCTYCDKVIEHNQPSWLVNRGSVIYYIYCDNKECSGHYNQFDTTPKKELLTDTPKPSELPTPGNNFRERYNNKKMLKRMLQQFEEMPTDRRAYFINSINQHYTTNI